MNATSLTTFAVFGALSVGTLPITLAFRGLDAGDTTHRRAGRALRSLARATVATTGTWRFSVAGAPPADLDARPCVVIANHASLADPFLLAHLPFDQRFVAKAELFRPPLIGWLMRLGGDIPLRRGDRASAEAMIATSVETLRRGLSVTLFPEGTRTRNGQLGRFHDGAFRIAVAAGVRILPVALHGTADCVDAQGPRPATACAEILSAIEPDGRSVASLRDQARDALDGALAARRGTPRAVRDFFLDSPCTLAGAT